MDHLRLLRTNYTALPGKTAPPGMLRTTCNYSGFLFTAPYLTRIPKQSYVVLLSRVEQFYLGRSTLPPEPSYIGRITLSGAVLSVPSLYSFKNARCFESNRSFQLSAEIGHFELENEIFGRKFLNFKNLQKIRWRNSTENRIQHWLTARITM